MQGGPYSYPVVLQQLPVQQVLAVLSSLLLPGAGGLLLLLDGVGICRLIPMGREVRPWSRLTAFPARLSLG